jgi:uncharacterized membrane protein YagU involved in acid resistance
MALLSRFIVLIPLVFSIASAVLAALALFAGHEKGFMENYAVARLNTSRIGYNLVDISNKKTKRGLFGDDEDEAQDNNDGDDSLWDDIQEGAGDIWDDVSGEIENQLNDIGNNLADELAETLGLSEWYSLHIMSACQGFFTPEPTASNPGLNISYCNNTAPEDAFNLQDVIETELSLGPFDLSLEDIGWSDDIQNQVDKINDVLLAMFILYVLGMAFSIIGVITAVLSFVWAHKRSLVLINLGVIGIAMACLVVGSIIVTVAVTEGIDKINDLGEDIGISVNRGNNFLAITWAAAGLTIVSFLIWCFQLCFVWRQRKRNSVHSHHQKSTI